MRKFQKSFYIECEIIFNGMYALRKRTFIFASFGKLPNSLKVLRSKIPHEEWIHSNDLILKLFRCLDLSYHKIP